MPQVYTTSSGALASPGAWQLPGFPGQSRTFADLYYNRHRDYDPSTGRYIQADPIGLAGDTNPYVYAGANPVTGIDPDGLSAAAIGGAIVRFASRATPAGRIGWMIGAVARVLVNQINVQPSVSRPKELTRLEERQFDRYCVNSQDPCKALRLAADQAIENARIKRMAMLNDKGGMFGHVGWATHAADLAGRLANIHAMISLGEKMGCPMSDQRRKLREISVPNSPSSKG